MCQAERQLLPAHSAPYGELRDAEESGALSVSNVDGVPPHSGLLFGDRAASDRKVCAFHQVVPPWLPTRTVVDIDDGKALDAIETRGAKPRHESTTGPAVDVTITTRMEDASGQFAI